MRRGARRCLKQEHGRFADRPKVKASQEGAGEQEGDVKEARSPSTAADPGELRGSVPTGDGEQTGTPRCHGDCTATGNRRAMGGGCPGTHRGPDLPPCMDGPKHNAVLECLGPKHEQRAGAVVRRGWRRGLPASCEGPGLSRGAGQGLNTGLCCATKRPQLRRLRPHTPQPGWKREPPAVFVRASDQNSSGRRLHLIVSSTS